MIKTCLITNDVETTSLLNHKLSDKTGKQVLIEGMPRLLELYAKHDVTATFFFTGYIAKLYPEIVKMILPYGHEVASHGLSHETNQAFDVLSLEQQIQHLKQSKDILENISGGEVISFRAPAARVNNNIPLALMEAGYKVDSSVSSQRLDMFFSYGSRKKLNWLFTPRKPYFTADDNIFKKGTSPILEIPISALGFPYIGTFMRMFPSLNRMTRNLLHLETKLTGRPFNFLTHPNEFIDEESDSEGIKRRSDSYLAYYFKDVLRHKLKLKNIGKEGIPILEKELEFFNKNNYQFSTCKELYNNQIKNK